MLCHCSVSLSLPMALYLLKECVCCILACPCSNFVLTFIFTSSNQTSLRELRERVANGGDPSKLREPPVVDDIPDGEQGNLLSMYLHFAIKVSNSKYIT